MAKLDFFALLSYGSIGLGCILAVLTYFLLRREQANPKPRKPLLNSIFGFMVFSLLLCVLGIVAQFIEKRMNGNGQSEPRPFPPGHPGNVIIPELKAIEQAAIYRRNLRWQFTFSDMVPDTTRARLKLSAEYEILNASDRTLYYALEASFEVPTTFSAKQIRGELLVKSAQGVTELQNAFFFIRSKDIFSYRDKVNIPSGQSKTLHWQTLEEFEVETPYHDYLFSVNPTDTMEIMVRSGNTNLKPEITLQRGNQTGSLEKVAPGVYSFKAPGPFLPFQGVGVHLQCSIAVGCRTRRYSRPATRRKPVRDIPVPSARAGS